MNSIWTKPHDHYRKCTCYCTCDYHLFFFLHVLSANKMQKQVEVRMSEGHIDPVMKTPENPCSTFCEKIMKNMVLTLTILGKFICTHISSIFNSQITCAGTRSTFKTRDCFVMKWVTRKVGKSRCVDEMPRRLCPQVPSRLQCQEGTMSVCRKQVVFRVIINDCWELKVGRF